MIADVSSMKTYALVLLAVVSSALARVDMYPGPEGISPSAKYAVTIIQDGKRYSSFVYLSKSKFHLDKRGATTSWTTFSFSDPVKVEVTKLDGEVKSCVTRPSRFGIKAKIQDNTATFTLDRPRKLSVEFNGDITHSMLLFADALESDPPKSTDENVMYFAPGQHTIGIGKRIPANTTVYLAGGAYVFGSLKVDGDNVTIRGRGVLSGDKWRKYKDFRNPESGRMHDFKMIHGRNSNCRIEGITIVDFPSFAIIRCNLIENVKTIGWYYNCDGVDVPENGLVKDCFLKVNDDALKLYWDNSRAEDIIIWQYMNGAPFQWGWHGMSSSNVTVKNCDIIHVEYQGDANNRAVFNAARKRGGRRSNYLFENIYIEELDLWRLFKLNLSDGAEISNNVFRNLHVAGQLRHKNQINGKGRVGFVFENMTLNGKPVTDAGTAGFLDKDTLIATFR